MQSNDIINVLENEEARSFISRHINDNLSAISLKYANKTSFNITVCLQLMSIYKKGKKKLPLFCSQMLAIDQRSYEQCTSEAVALYKSSFISGKSLLDITGGLGVDSLFLSKNIDQVQVVEKNSGLHELAAYNIKKLKLANVTRICGDGVFYINKDYEWIYIDPDRRAGQTRAVVLSLLLPNVVEIMPLISKHSKKVYIKLSPLFDIYEVWREFSQVSVIHIIAERGEIKEVGVILDMSLSNNSSVIKLHDVHSHFSAELNVKSIGIPLSKGNETTFPYLSMPISLVAKSYSMSYFLTGQAVYKHLTFDLFYTSNSVLEGFKSYKIIECSPLNSKKVKSMLYQRGITQVNLIIKGINDSPSQWHKKLRTKDGGDYFLFILKGEVSEAILTQIIFGQQ